MKYNFIKNIILGIVLVSFMHASKLRAAIPNGNDWLLKKVFQLRLIPIKGTPWLLGMDRKTQIEELQASLKWTLMPIIVRDPGGYASDYLTKQRIINNTTGDPIKYDDFWEALELQPLDKFSKETIAQLDRMREENPYTFDDLTFTLSDIRKYATYLHKAVVANSIEATQALLMNGFPPNASSRHGTTPLHLAATKNNPDIVNLLTAHAANPNAEDEHRQTPLHVAILASIDPGIIDMLLAAGANCDAQNQDGTTPLHYAVCHNPPGVVQQLLKKCKDINLCTKQGETLLYRAVVKQDAEKIQILCDAGAKITGFPNKPNSNSLKKAEEIVELLNPLCDDPAWQANPYWTCPVKQQEKAQRIYDDLLKRADLEESN
ncbi:MAG: ankyrin repeat domain-containing protein [Puniceicoccales bacterium]|jgi:ankyrin repeat protein|nr:ankyrin repeat domain-containing protein [Puniceicoccales bacterium]